MKVVRYRKQLTSEPLITAPINFRLRNFEPARDVKPWLDLRNLVFATRAARGRDWGETDFYREFTRKRWFAPQQMWVAESINPDDVTFAGCVTLELDPQMGNATIHWLMVSADKRRQGIGAKLLQFAERSAWQAGNRVVRCETLSTWEPAARFYQSMGYTIT